MTNLKPKHTPGPWHVALDGGGVASVDHWLIAGSLNAPDTEIRLANARLIAAAPDMLTELRGARSTMANVLDDIADLETIAPDAVSTFLVKQRFAEIDAVIKKAEGRT